MRVNLMVFAYMANYDKWLEEAFLPDASRRSLVCDDSRTTVARISETKAIILMYDVEMEAMEKHMNAKQMKVLEEKFNVEHEIFTFSPID